MRTFLLFIYFLSIISICKAQKTEEPKIDSVTIDPKTNLVYLAWHVDNVIPEIGYIIFRQIFVDDPKYVKPVNSTSIEDKGYYPIDTIFNTSKNNSYIDNKKTYYGVVNPLYHPVSYKIRSINSQSTNNGSAASSPSNTMMLIPVYYNKCNSTNTLRWYSNQAWNGEIEKYEVFVKLENAADYTFLAPLNGNDTAYVDKNIWPKTKYSYFIKCTKKNGSSSSTNFVSSTTPVDSLPKTLILDYVSVEGGIIKISVSIDPSKQAKAYYIMRGETENARYDTVTSFENANTPFTFKDLNARPEKTYFYKAMVKNSCGIPYKYTVYSNNIVLYATSSISSPNNNHIDWNPYKNWIGGVKEYKLYRTIDNGGANLIATINANNHSFDDDITSIKQTASSPIQKVCYYVEAEEGNPNTVPIPGFSKSNVYCVIQDSKIEMPNAFNPSSKLEQNRFFKPNFDHADGYQLIIYDRWGFKIFETTEPLIGWHGRSKDNNLVPEGVYVYFLSYLAGGKKIDQSGTVTVVSTNE